MSLFLAKTEPSAYSIDQLAKDGTTDWTGVRNPQAVRAIREMRPGDRVFIYHSGGESAVVGVAEVVAVPRDDPNDSKSAVVDLRFVAKLDEPITLKEIKASGKFEDWALVRQSRLSTMAAPASFEKLVREKNPKTRF